MVVGVSHRTAPLDVRERLAVAPDELSDRLHALCGLPGIRESTLLSTCNRVEIYAAATDRLAAFAALQGYLGSRLGADEQARALEPHLYRRHGRAALHHLFRVAASLDSLVVGEPQILGQVKEALQTAERAGTVGRVLGSSFSRAFRVARRIRRETGIGTQSISVSSVAVDLAGRVFDGFLGRKVLLIGAGKMSALAARALALAGAKVMVTNRSAGRGEDLAAHHGFTAVPFDRLEAALCEADIIVSSTGARTPILDRQCIERVQRMRRNRSLVIVDIAVPRDVEPAVARVDGVFLWDIDDLQSEAARNLEGRRREAEAAETLIEEEVVRFLNVLRGQAVGPTIRALRARFNDIARDHGERLKIRLGNDPRIGAEIERMAQALVNELLHAPQVVLRRAAAGEEGDYLAGAVQKLFDLPELVPAQPATACVSDAEEEGEEGGEGQGGGVDRGGERGLGS